MKTAIIALAAVALVAAAPAALARAASGKTTGPHQPSRKHHPAVARRTTPRAVQARGPNNGYPGAFGYAPDESGRIDRDLEMSRQAGGGGM